MKDGYDIGIMYRIRLIIQGWTSLILDKISDIRYKKYFDERRGICQSCDKAKLGFCLRCGCVIKAKVMAEESYCPDGKWLSISDTLKEKED